MSGSSHAPPPPPPPNGGYVRRSRGQYTRPAQPTVHEDEPGTEQFQPVVEHGPSTAPMTAVGAYQTTPNARWEPAEQIPVAPQAAAVAPPAQDPSGSVPTTPTPPASGKQSRPLGLGWWAFIVVDVILVVMAIMMGINAFGGDSEAESATTDTSVESPSPEPVEEVADAVAFRSPSSNILCEISADGARCEIAQRASEAAAVDGCEGTVGYVVTLSADGVDQPCIAPDDQPVAAPAGVPEVEYGDSRTEGNFVCNSEKSGVSCQDTTTGTGFNVARAGITTF